MAGASTPRALGLNPELHNLNDGTMVRALSPRPGPIGTETISIAWIISEESNDDDAFNKTFQGGKDEGAFDTSERLKRGNLGEKLAADALAIDGHHILSYKPSILGTNQGGIDIVTIKNGIVYFIDNKALTRSGNVSSVSALTTHFVKNKDAVLNELKDVLTKFASQNEKNILQSAITAIEKGNYKKVVTNANLTKNDAILSGISQRLKDQGLEFIDVFKL